eukprot:12929193-Prorocentrum_lima.AAC.1
MCVTIVVDQKWQERVGRREQRAPPEPTPLNAETARVIESLERRLSQVETNQEEMNILRRKQ